MNTGEVGGLIYTIVAVAAFASAAELAAPESDQGARLVAGLCAVASVLFMVAAILRLAG
jgi:hypothetical protein